MSKEDIEGRRFQAESAQAAVRVAQAQLNELRTQSNRMVIRAPVSGTVLERNVRPGEVSGAAQPLFRIARDGLIELDAEIPEDQLAQLTVGTKAQVFLPSGHQASGSVRLVSPRVDPQTKLGRVRVELERDPGLRPGGYARAVFSFSAHPVPAVPEKAIQFEASGPQLVVIDRDNRAHRVPVKTGAHADGFVALLQGPAVGTRVALGGGAFLLDGDLVTPVEAETAASRSPTVSTP